MTTSAHASSKDICSTASTEKFESGSAGANIRARARALDRLHVWVNGVNFVPFPQEVNEVSTGTASGVQDSHSGRDAAFQKLVEKIDVDLAKLLLERGHFHKPSRAVRLCQVSEPWTFVPTVSYKLRAACRSKNVMRC